MYRRDIDVLKGIAIIAVVMYHIGLLKSGYLGVDVLFVVNGFLIVHPIVSKIASGSFSFFGFIEKRVVRLLPLIVLASVVSLFLGYFLMLPDHYENLAQSVIAGNLMSENILSAITTGNYWDVVNGYKPLMHLWYIGILFEFYIVMPVLLLITNKCAAWAKRDGTTWMISVLVFASLASLVLFLWSSVSVGDKFYYLPYRFFELGIGGIVGLYVSKINLNGHLGLQYVNRIAVVLLVAVLCCSLYYLVVGYTINTNYVIGRPIIKGSGLPISSNIALLATVFLSSVVVACNNEWSLLLRSKVLAWLGKMSYSIFIWHQVLLAFYRYSISSNMNLSFTGCFLIVTLVVSAISYYLFEKRIAVSRKSLIGWCIAAILVMLPSTYLFLHAGVVRDVPELGIVKGTEHRGMFREYCDRVYQLTQFPEEDNGKPNVLVEGVSFGRDFTNVLLESSYRDSINLVYVFNWKEEDIIDNVAQSDFIFCFSPKDNVPEFVWQNMPANCIIKGISTKNYGSCNGIVYKNRNSSNYYKQTATPEPGYLDLNDEWKQQWGDDYIDLITPALVGDGQVRVFTDDQRYISQDCRHLTQAGAQWYAKILDWESIFNN